MIFLLGGAGRTQNIFLMSSLSLTSLGNQLLAHAAYFNSQTFYYLSLLSKGCFIRLLILLNGCLISTFLWVR